MTASTSPGDAPGGGPTLAEVAAMLDVPDLPEEEQALVLDLARVVAHTTERRFAPLVSYALGLALGSAPPAERTARLRDAIASAQTGTTDARTG